MIFLRIVCQNVVGLVAVMGFLKTDFSFNFLNFRLHYLFSASFAVSHHQEFVMHHKWIAFNGCNLIHEGAFL